MRVSDDIDAQAGLARNLTRSYPRMENDQVGELLRLLGNQDTEAVAAAIDQHLLGSAAKFPPQPGQLLEHIQTAERDARRESTLPVPTGRRKRVAVPESLQRYFKASHLNVWPSNCHECSDTGFARFYTSTDERRVYLATEALELPEGIFAKLRVNRAICDCDAGFQLPERDLRTTRYPDLKGHEMNTHIRLETIRRMSKIRQRRERQEVGA